MSDAICILSTYALYQHVAAQPRYPLEYVAFIHKL